jgi:hypothetical protein
MDAKQLEGAHDECWPGEPCKVDPRACPHEEVRQRRAGLRGSEWGQLELRREGSGLRHYLDGEPVHCGAGLELQAIEYKSDDVGEFTTFLQRGRGVRYEASTLQVVSRDGRPQPSTLHAQLYTVVDGHSFVARAEAWMRFRWPRARS